MSVRHDVFEEALLELFAPVREYLDDPSITEIMINGHDAIFIERRGRLIRTPATFSNPRALLAALRNAAQFVGKSIDADQPVLEGRLPDGSRLAAVMPPAGPGGPYVSIRRFSKEKLTMEKLVELEALTNDARSLLDVLVKCKQNILVAGGTGSGKTSLLNALSASVPEDERVVVIEDNKELQIQRDHVVTLEARPPDARGKGEVSIRHLFKVTLRMRPDRIIIGEIRGGEALDLVQAMTSGHGGCLGTLHATYPRDALTRLETMASMSDIELPLSALRAQISSAINVVVQVARFSDGTRKLSHVSEVLGYDSVHNRYAISDLLVRRVRSVDRVTGTVDSVLEPTGRLPACYEALKTLGYDVPRSVHDAVGNGGRADS